MASKYIFLEKPEFIQTWIDGGTVPLNLASSYKRAERAGIYTPDENRLYDGTHSLETLRDAGVRIEGTSKVYIESLYYNDRLVGNDIAVNMGEEDGVIISLCNSNRPYVQRRMNKCGGVDISDVYQLKQVIDEQLGVVGIAKNCEYTGSHNRNTFLKSIHDQWQNEFRIFWPVSENVKIEIPKGLARPLPRSVRLVYYGKQRI